MRAGFSIAGALPVAILLGLLAVPAECRCGASRAHPHSLFTLPGHDHAGNGQGSQTEHAGTNDENLGAYRLTTGAPGMPGRTATLPGPANVFAVSDTVGERVVIDNVSVPTGVLDSPDPPPPR
jgi:hypothetical protein